MRKRLKSKYSTRAALESSLEFLESGLKISKNTSFCIASFLISKTMFSSSKCCFHTEIHHFLSCKTNLYSIFGIIVPIWLWEEIIQRM